VRFNYGGGAFRPLIPFCLQEGMSCRSLFRNLRRELLWAHDAGPVKGSGPVVMNEERGPIGSPGILASPGAIHIGKPLTPEAGNAEPLTFFSCIPPSFWTARLPFESLERPLHLALRQMSLCLPKHPDDLLYCKTFPLHPDLLSASDPAITLTQNLDQFLRGRSAQ